MPLNPESPPFVPEEEKKERAEADALLKEAVDVGTSGSEKGGRKRTRKTKSRKSKKSKRKTRKH